MYLLNCQICVSKMVFCILFYVSSLNTMWRKLPPTLLSKECFTAVVASDKHSAVTSLVKWDIYGHAVKLHVEFSKEVFAITPDGEGCRNIFFCNYVDCQDINRINGVQSYFTLTVWKTIPACASGTIEIGFRKWSPSSDPSPHSPHVIRTTYLQSSTMLRSIECCNGVLTSFQKVV